MDSIKGLVRSPGCLQVSPLKRHSRALAWWNGRKTRPCSPYKPSKSLNLERTSWVHTPTKYIKILFCGTRMVSPFFLKEAVNWMNISLVGTLQGCRSTIHESSSCYLLLEIPDYEWHWIRIFPKWRSSPYSISRNPHAKEARYAITAHGLEPPYASLSCSRSKTCLLSGWKTGCNNRWRTPPLWHPDFDATCVFDSSQSKWYMLLHTMFWRPLIQLNQEPPWSFLGHRPLVTGRIERIHDGPINQVQLRSTPKALGHSKWWPVKEGQEVVLA